MSQAPQAKYRKDIKSHLMRLLISILLLIYMTMTQSLRRYQKLLKKAIQQR